MSDVLTTELQNVALAFVAQGKRITLSEGKAALGIGWKPNKYEAESYGLDFGLKVWTPEEITAAYQARGALNVGLLLGEQNGLIDIEADSEEQEAAFAELFEGSEAPVTPTFESRRGKHRLFAWHPGLAGAKTNDKGVVEFKGLGIRIGNGKQAHSVVPPSVNDDDGTVRQWLVSLDDCPPAMLPDLVVQRIVEANKRPDASQQRTQASGTITEGKRNDTLYRLASRWRREGNELSEIESKLSDENSKRCNPPLSAEEITEIASNACRHKPAADILLHDNRNDTENARRFAREHAREGAEVIRYVESWKKWIVWTGKRWEVDPDEIRVEKLAKRTVDQLWEDISSVIQGADKPTACKLLSHHKQSASLKGIRAMIRLARGEDGILISHTELDQHPWLLNVANGTVDLRKGKLREHRREDFLTQLSGVIYDPKADCPRFESFVDEIMAHNRGLVEFLHRLCGYWLTGDVSEHIFPIWYGGGSNGKSLFLKLLETLLGEYAKKCTQDMLLVTKHDSLPIERADLFAKRLAFSIEIDAGRRLNEALLKELTGGDAITARHLYQEMFTFNATHKVVMACNHKPVIRGADDGLWRRVSLVPFDVHFWNPDKGETGPANLVQDKDLFEKLKLELSGILNWCIFGGLKWRCGKSLAIPKQVQEATEQYKEDSDIYGDFITSTCEVHADKSAPSALLYSHYQTWCSRNGFEPDTNKTFGNKLVERGFKRKHTKEGKVFMGLRLTVIPVD